MLISILIISLIFIALFIVEWRCITSIHEGVAFLGFIIREKNLSIDPKGWKDSKKKFI